MTTADVMLDLHERMVRCMRWEQRLLDMHAEGRLSGFYHAGRGQEAAQVGAIANLGPDDHLLYAHRGCGYMVARGMPMDVLFADLLGYVEGSARGLGAGIVHIAWPPLGILGQSGTLGGSFPIAVGAALASKLRGADHVTLCFFGDGTSNRGTFHEAANAASVWKLPIVWLCENNGLAVSTTIAEGSSVKSIAVRAAGYNMPGVVVDGQDAVAVYEATRTAVERARRGEGPTLIEAMTCRFRGHYEGDSQAYRDRAELERSKRERDPIELLARRIRTEVPDAETKLQAIEVRVAEQVDRAARTALAGTPPKRERIFDYIYA